MLQAAGGLEIRERCLLAGHGGVRLRQRRPVVPVVELDQQIAGMDLLVVGNGDLGDEAGDLRRDDRHIAAHIGVVRALGEAPDRPPVVAEPPRPGGGQQGGPGEGQPLAGVPRGADRRRDNNIPEQDGERGPLEHLITHRAVLSRGR